MPLKEKIKRYSIIIKIITNLNVIKLRKHHIWIISKLMEYLQLIIDSYVNNYLNLKKI